MTLEFYFHEISKFIILFGEKKSALDSGEKESLSLSFGTVEHKNLLALTYLNHANTISELFLGNPPTESISIYRFDYPNMTPIFVTDLDPKNRNRLLPTDKEKQKLEECLCFLQENEEALKIKKLLMLKSRN